MLAPAKTPTSSRRHAGGVARVLERLPGALQEEPVLRVDDLGLARAEAEERGVEEVDVLEHAPARARTGGSQQPRVDARGGSSSSVKNVIDSTPRRRLCQSCARSAAPGKRPAMPDDRDGLHGLGHGAHRAGAPTVARARWLAIARMVGVLEQLDDRDLPPERVPQPRLHLDEQERVAAEVEEVVVHPDLVEPEHVAPDAGDGPLDLVARRRGTRPGRRCAAPPARAAGADPPCRSG